MTEGVKPRQEARVDVRKALEEHRARLVDLGAGVLLVASTLFMLANLLRGYHEPVAPLLAMGVGGLAALLLRRVGQRVELALLLVVATTLVGTLSVTLNTGDFVRVLPWWSYFVIYTAAAYDSVRGAVIVGLIFTVGGAVMAALFPTEIIPNQLVLAIIAPATMATAVGFNAISRRRLVDGWALALDEVKILRGVLPICMYCKKLRDDTGAWQAIEAYVVARTDAQFSPGECESCRAQTEPSRRGAAAASPAPTSAMLARQALEQQRKRLLNLGLTLIAVVPTTFVVANLAKGYWTPIPAQLAVVLCGLALVLAVRRGLPLNPAFLLTVALIAVGVTAVALLSHDFVRVFPWWPFFIFVTSEAFERARDAVAAAVFFAVLAVTLAVVVPGKGIPNLVLAAALVPTMTAIVAGYQAASRRRLAEALTRALEAVRELRGVLPICTRCKKLRDEAGVWHQLEAYVTDHSDAKFSHGVCEECLPKIEADFGMR